MTIYTENFDVATHMVRTFIASQKVVYIKNMDDMFGEGSWMSNFFNFSLNQLTHPEVVKQLDKLLDIGGDEQRPFNTALARINALYTQIVMACGYKFILEMEECCIQSLMCLNDETRNQRRNVYKSFRRIFNKYPVLIISALGNDYFSNERMTYLHGNKMTMPSIPRPGFGSVK